ncbi:uncharacterized protein [Epargyreus clarus]|uniref:uncharacterized protein isoform X2 n=1 Tax=Epargyreus clarus TaxID=520877 RepID=UPI003C2EC3F3
MECTQRIECTQDVLYTPAQRVCPKQIGFLGINGIKYPVSKGPNKIGRDPKTCDIILDENTISRQHAVINIMNENKFVIMDLESSNKTKLLGTTIHPYTPHALKNGDTVQFGDVFGVFRLLDDDVDDLPLTQAADLPLTQAVDFPATPVNIRHVSRMNNGQIKMVPETPDVSDRDESVIEHSPHRNIGNKKSNNNNHFKSPSIRPNKIDNTYWNSSKKSDSFSRHFESNSSTLVNEASVSSKQITIMQNDISELETQQPNLADDDLANPSIYEENTQKPNKVTLPNVCKVQDQSNVQLNLYSTNKRYTNIYNAKTQLVLGEKEDMISISTAKERDKPVDDEDLTDFEDDMIELNKKSESSALIDNKSDDDVTDCEDDIIEVSQNRCKVNDTFHDPENENFEDLPTQVIGGIETKGASTNDGVPFEDMLTQVIEECPTADNVEQTRKDIDSPILFKDLQTQVIENVTSKEPETAGSNTMFKVPNSPLRSRRKETSPVKKISNSTPILTVETNSENQDEEHENYYAATQEIMNDLCSQSIINGYDFEMDANKLSIDTSVRYNSSEASDGNEKIEFFVSNLSKEQVRDVIGVDVAPLTKKKSSDSSDLEITPKKFNPSKFLNIDLPNSQDIKSCKFVSSKVHETDSSDGFEETDDQDDMSYSTSSDGRGKKRRNIKLDLSKKFDVDILPTRAITRIRKCTAKILESDDTSRKKSEKILESKLGLDNKVEIDNEVVKFNLARLRNKMEKAKNKNGSKSSDQDLESPKESKPKPIEPKKRKSNEKVLKQQNITSMLKTKSNGDLGDAKEINTKSKDTSTRKRRSPRNTKKIEETVAKIEEVTTKPRGKKKANSREHAIEIVESPLEEPLPRRSKRNPTTDKNKEKVEKTRNSKKGKESVKSDEAHTKSQNSSKDNKSTSRERSASSKRSLEKSAERASSGRQSTQSSKNKEHSTEKSRKSRTRERSKTGKSADTSSGSTSNPTKGECSLEKNTDGVFKRPSSEMRPPPSKRTKLSKESPETTKSGRGIKVHYVVFTAFNCDPVAEKLRSLGAVIITDVKRCTVVVTQNLRRTCKVLCAVGLGKPIVGPDWVQACSDARMIVDPWLYLIKDEEMEKRQKFNLQRSLTCKRNFLKGYNVSSTPNANPNSDIVECSGGTFGEGGNKWLCLSCPRDEHLWTALRRRGANMIDTETFLTSIMRQELNIKVSRPRNTRQRDACCI